MEDDEKRRILIVDDTPNNIRVLVPTLMDSGDYQINIANNGFDALTLLEKVRPDLILLDVMMPEMDGFETCQRIKGNSDLNNIPIIFLTAKNDTADIVKGFEVGAADFISKPFNSVELLSRVRTHIDLKVSRDLLKTRLEKLVEEKTRELVHETQEKLKLKEQFHQAQKMEAIGQLAGGVAHDFNNQLGGIIGSAELIKHFNKDEKVNKYADLILKSAQSSANLTKQLLAFARKGKEISTPIYITQVIEHVTELLRRSLDKKIEMVHEHNCNSSLILGDSSQIENAILNIAINAGHAMPDGGCLTFKTEVIDSFDVPELSLKAGNYILTTISDTGTGMNPEILERIFDPFFTTKEKGTGLGLSATYGTIQEHEGDIRVASRVGQGTSFYIYLPCSENKTSQLEETSNSEISLTGRKIMIIDDEQIILITLSEILESLGCEVITCDNGEEAIGLYRQSSDSIDMVILDKVMPKMNGLEVFRELKLINPQIKALLASGYSEDQAQQMIDDGIGGFIRKPFNIQTLKKNIVKVL